MNKKYISKFISGSCALSYYKHNCTETYEFTSSSFLSSRSFSRHTSSWSRRTSSLVVNSSAFSLRSASFSVMQCLTNSTRSCPSISASFSKSTVGGVFRKRRPRQQVQKQNSVHSSIKLNSCKRHIICQRIVEPSPTCIPSLKEIQNLKLAVRFYDST